MAGAVGVVALLALAPAASAQYTPGGSLTLAFPSVAAGGSDTATLTGCNAGAEATLTLSNGTTLATGTANAEGVATLPFTVPASTAPGTYTLTATCMGPDGMVTATAQLVVTAAGTTPTTTPGGSGTLPRTGSDNSTLIRAGVVLLAVGGIAALVARKRTQVKA